MFMKKLKPFILGILLVIIFLFIIIYIMRKSLVADLEKYDMANQEFYEFHYKHNTYAISSVGNEGVDKTGIFFKQNKNYYLMAMEERCTYSDNSFYVKDGIIYMHCNSKEKSIITYAIDSINYKKSEFPSNFKDTPNISKLHLQFNKIDDDYLYLYSLVKVDDTIEEGNQIKCSLSDYKCQYDKGYTPYKEKIDKSYKLVYKEESPDNKKSYTVSIYQNKDNVSVIINSNTNFGNMQYSVKSNRKITKDDIKIEWTELAGDLYRSPEEKIGKVSISILDRNNKYTDYSWRIINLKTKDVYIGDNEIIK